MNFIKLIPITLKFNNYWHPLISSTSNRPFFPWSEWSRNH